MNQVLIEKLEAAVMGKVREQLKSGIPDTTQIPIDKLNALIKKITQNITVKQPAPHVRFGDLKRGLYTIAEEYWTEVYAEDFLEKATDKIGTDSPGSLPERRPAPPPPEQPAAGNGGAWYAPGPEPLEGINGKLTGTPRRFPKQADVTTEEMPDLIWEMICLMFQPTDRAEALKRLTSFEKDGKVIPGASSLDRVKGWKELRIKTNYGKCLKWYIDRFFPKKK